MSIFTPSHGDTAVWDANPLRLSLSSPFAERVTMFRSHAAPLQGLGLQTGATKFRVRRSFTGF